MFPRQKYLDSLVRAQRNGMIIIITCVIRTVWNRWCMCLTQELG